NALLQSGDVRSGKVPADPLRPHGGGSVLEVRTYLSTATRTLSLASAQRARKRDTAELARARRARDLSHLRRADSGPRRSGRKRHGYSDRQAATLHGLRRRAAPVPSAGACGLRHDESGLDQRPTLSRSAPTARLGERIG